MSSLRFNDLYMSAFFILIYKALAKIAIEKNICKIFLLNKQKEKSSASYPLHSKYVSFSFLWINLIFLLLSKKIVSIFSYLGNWLKETDNKTNLEDDKRGKKVWVANTKQNNTKQIIKHNKNKAWLTNQLACHSQIIIIFFFMVQ